MKRIMAVCATLLIAPFAEVLAQPKTLGVGIVIGTPTGFTLKYWSSPTQAIQGYLGGGFGGVTVGADYLFHSNAFNNPDIPFYYGPGVFVGSSKVGGPRLSGHQTGLGARMMFGADYVFRDHPFDIAFEIGPALFLSPLVGAGLEAGLAFRFYP